MSVDVAGELVLSSIVMFIFSPAMLPSTWHQTPSADRWWIVLSVLLFFAATVLWIHAVRALLLHFT